MGGCTASAPVPEVVLIKGLDGKEGLQNGDAI